MPIRTLLDKLANDPDRDETETYDKNKLTFPDDYDRSNPVTKDKATIKFLEELSELTQDKTEKEAMKQTIETAK
jgi:hypothetical protein